MKIKLKKINFHELFQIKEISTKKLETKKKKKKNVYEIKTKFDFHKLFEIKQISTKRLRKKLKKKRS